jgi:DNA repair protein RadC
MIIPVYRTVEIGRNPDPESYPLSKRPFSIPRYHISLVKESEMDWPTSYIRSAAEAYEIAKVIFAGYDREAMFVFMLDQKNQIIGINLISTGTLTEALIHPRELFKAIVLSNSASFLMVHNHPSGDPAPGNADRQLTARIKDVASLIGVRMIDSIIVGESSYYSFAESTEWTSIGAPGVIRVGERGQLKWSENPRKRRHQ